MKKNILVSILVIAFAVTAISGATLAWFTAEADPIVNEFTAGTVNISAEETVEPIDFMKENWNPGDCAEKEYTIINTGTKGIYVRVKLTGQWFENDRVTPFTPDPDESVVALSVEEGSTWTQVGDYWYFDSSVLGTYTEENIDARTIKLALNVCLDGPNTGNQYQGKVFKLTAEFEAIQSSNNAVHDVWEGNPFPVIG
jgi:alternate signal-mediated exported protein